MKVRNRIRCPFCGALSWDSQWNRDYPVEMLSMNCIGRSKGVKGCFEYAPVTNPAVLDRMKYFIVERCKDIIERLSLPKPVSDQHSEYIAGHNFMGSYVQHSVPEREQEVIYNGESEGVFGYRLHEIFLS